ncbi:hypothetical protein IT570_08030 [Candidatus Sumerlaeota bacterium]|nr:hypothetical protein [Candidatus Sumerlaeota bacterium]
MNERFHPPFSHPRRDPYIRRARFLAAAVLSFTNAFWFVCLATVVMNGAKLTALLSLTAIIGLVWISTRAREASELSTAVINRLAGFEMAPLHGDIASRILAGSVAPALCLLAAFLARDNGVIALTALLLFLVSEAVFRLGGVRQWRSSQVPFPIMRALLTATPNAAMQALEAEKGFNPRSLETTVLAISSAAMREKSGTVVPRLIDLVGSHPVVEAGGPQVKERLRAVLRADAATIARDVDEVALQAKALMLLPPLHPRRSSLSLLVATEAMAANDHVSAIKALRMLHSGEVLGSMPRLLVDWFLAESARIIGDQELHTRSASAIRTFNIARVLRELNLEELRRRDDTTARMICAAHDALRAPQQSQERPTTLPS